MPSNVPQVFSGSCRLVLVLFALDEDLGICADFFGPCGEESSG